MGKLLDMSKVARLGGKARAKKLSAEERRDIARKGGLAARGKPRKKYRRNNQKKKKLTSSA